MLINQLNIIKINLLLVVAIIILSVFTIIWHHQNYLLYKQSIIVERHNQQIVAMHKQLASEHSQQINGFQIKNRALKILNMQLPTKSKRIAL